MARFYRGQGFAVTSVVCKVGRVPKERIGLRDDQKIAIGSFESMCNPITQAECVNSAGTELNVVLGLCVGHDSLVFRHSRAPCTVLAAKDRLLGHNPLAAVYTMQGYYSYLTRTPGGRDDAADVGTAAPTTTPSSSTAKLTTGHRLP